MCISLSNLSFYFSWLFIFPSAYGNPNFFSSIFLAALGLSCSMWDLPLWCAGFSPVVACRFWKIPHAVEQLSPCATTIEARTGSRARGLCSLRHAGLVVLRHVGS